MGDLRCFHCLGFVGHVYVIDDQDAVEMEEGGIAGRPDDYNLTPSRRCTREEEKFYIAMDALTKAHDAARAIAEGVGRFGGADAALQGSRALIVAQLCGGAAGCAEAIVISVSGVRPV